MSATIASTGRHADLACKGVSPDVFFPAAGSTAAEERAKAVCEGCPARAGCLDFALEHDEQGVWAGTTEQERRDLRRARALPLPAAPVSVPPPPAAASGPAATANVPGGETRRREAQQGKTAA